MQEIQQTASNGFNLQVSNMTEAMSVAEMIARSNLAPKDYKGKPDDILVAMMMGNEVGLNPIQAIQNIAVINGRPSIWGDAMLALVQNNPAFQSIEETFDEESMTAFCTVVRKGSLPHTASFSQADATTAGLWGVNTWKKYPKRMLTMRARGFALRNQFADALLGLISREEALDTSPVEKEINPLQAQQSSIETIKQKARQATQQTSPGKNLDDILLAIQQTTSNAELTATSQLTESLSEDEKSIARQAYKEKKLLLKD